jgi:hypothetical protein
MQTSDGRTGVARDGITGGCAVTVQANTSEIRAMRRLTGLKRTSVRFLLDKNCWDTAAGQHFTPAGARTPRDVQHRRTRGEKYGASGIPAAIFCQSPRKRATVGRGK